MGLRRKLFAGVLAVMAIGLLLLLPAILLQGMESGAARAETERRLDAAARALFKDAAASTAPDRWERLARLLEDVTGRAGWQLRRGGEFLLGWRQDKPVGMDEIASSGDVKLLRPAEPPSLVAARSLTWFLWAVAATAGMMLLVVYGLLLRLVIRPVERLVEASQALARGAEPGRVAGEERADEVGQLVRGFNRMAAEVASGRRELERRVEEATREYRRAHERLAVEQRLSATGKLAAGLAHEIMNPLGGMLNAARTLSREKGLTERGAEYVALVVEGLERIRALVERMRAFVRPRPAVGRVDLVKAVESAFAFAFHRIEAEGVSSAEDYPEDEVAVTGDAGELQQVFLNLILNALDAVKGADAKRISIKVTADEGAGRATVLVADTGSGMDEEALASAFDLFYSTKGEEGSGLGLAVAHRIVTDHGGELELASRPGEGTTARVTLPLALAGACSPEAEGT